MARDRHSDRVSEVRRLWLQQLNDKRTENVAREHRSLFTSAPLRRNFRNQFLERRHAPPTAKAAVTVHHAAKSILVMVGGSCFSSILPALLIFASSALSSAPTSIAKPVQ